MIGQTLGNYRLLSELGRGGMARVYLAEHVVIGGHVAVKVLLPMYTSNEAMMQRFLNEARATASIKHPGIIKIFDYGALNDGRAYLVMEYLQGETLKERLRVQERLPIEQVLTLVRQMASALQAAHDVGVIHRDLKPDNVFLVPDAEVADGERAKILDFGIAKVAMDQAADRNHTQTGVLIGTPDYMSPEQCRGLRQIDHRSDLYSLGCIWYKMLTGRTPFADYATGEVVISHVMHKPVAPLELMPGIPPDVSTVIMRLLEKNPQDRPASAEDLRVDLERLSHATRRHRMPTQPLLPAVSSSSSFSTLRTAESDLGGLPSSSSSFSAFRPVGNTTGSTALAAVARPETTTLSAASAAFPQVSLPEPPPIPQRSAIGRFAIIALSGMALVSSALLVYTWSADTRQPGQSASAPLSSATAPHQAGSGENPGDGGDPARTGQPEQGANARAARITVEIESTPPGAEVYRLPQGARVGVTPVKLELEEMRGEYIFQLRKAGYEDHHLAADAAASKLYRVELRRNPAGAQRKPVRKPAAVEPKSPTKKPGKTDTLMNPFAPR